MRYLFLGLVLFPLVAWSLDSDRDQPVTIDADEVDIDFASGLRVYRGNVRVKQGTIRINADEIELNFKGDKLQVAVAKGRPAEFRQRPEGKDHDVIGRGLTIELDEVNNIVTLTDEASLTQNQDTLTGQTIVYNMATDKMKVRGGAAPTRTTKNPDQPQAPAAPTPAKEEPVQAPADGERPKIIIAPRNSTSTSN